MYNWTVSNPVYQYFGDNRNNMDFQVFNELEAFLGARQPKDHTGDPLEGMVDTGTEDVRTRAQRNIAAKQMARKTPKRK